MTETPCTKCPHFSSDLRDIRMTADPKIQGALKHGAYFVCHVNMGPCVGAKIRTEQLRASS